MALPPGISTVRMTGTLVDDSGTPRSGVVTLTPSTDLLVSAATDSIIPLVRRLIRLDENGQFYADLIPADEPLVQPHGVTWTMELPGDPTSTVTFMVPNGVASADIAAHITAISDQQTPQYLIGFRGIQGDTGAQGIQGPAGAPIGYIAQDANRPGASQPSLFIRAGSFVNLVNNPRGGAPEMASAEVRRNYATNPKLGVDATLWGYFAGTGGTAAFSRVATGGPAFAPAFARVTWSVAPTGVGGPYFGSTGAPGTAIAPGDLLSAAAWIRCSATNKYFTLRLEFVDSAGASIAGSTVTGPATMIAPNAWQRVVVSGVAPPLAARVIVTAYYANGSLPAVSETLDMTALVIEKGTVASDDYFDGSSTTTANITYTWTGTVDGSMSAAYSNYIEVRRNQAPDPSMTTTTGWTPTAATADISSAWAQSGSTSLRIVPTNAGIDSFVVAGAGNSFPFGMQAGKTYTISAYFYQAGAQAVGTLDARARRIAVYPLTTGNTFGALTQSAQAPNVAGAVRLSMTYTVPSNATGLNVRLYNGSNSPTDIVFWDALLVEETTTLGTYFDGATLASDPFVYEWAGNANASSSVQLAHRPAGWQVYEATPVGSTVTQRTFEDGSTGFRVLVPANAPTVAWRYFSYAMPVDLVKNAIIGGGKTSFPMRVRSSAATTLSVNVMSGTGTGGPHASLSLDYTTDWRNVSPQGTATAVPASSAVLYFTLPTSTATVDRWWDFSSTGFVVGGYDGPAFDGETGPAYWLGAGDNSPSMLGPGSLSYWNGTDEVWVNSGGLGLYSRLTELEDTGLVRRVRHDGVSYELRPEGVPAGLVEYVGPTEPVDWLTGDTWVEAV